MLERAKAAIDEVFCDTTVSPAETLSRMEELKGHVEEKIAAIEDDASAIAMADDPDEYGDDTPDE